jgi:glucan endo-1,3-alpha-glucosidase
VDLRAALTPAQNWIWRSNNMLMSVRWEQLLSMRDRIDQVQVIAWTDWGESSYFSPIRRDMPPEARHFANNDCESRASGVK